MKKSITLAMATASLLALSPAAHAAELSLDITNIKSSEGKLMIAVWDSAEGFLKGEAVRYRGRADAQEGSVSYVFPDLPPGDYALSVFHDEDGDGALKRNQMGIPREPLGMSRDARGVYGPPSYDDAVFTLPEEGLSLVIRLK